MPLSLVFPWLTPRWDWVQVEVTTQCQARCSYCPHTVYAEAWEGRHLPRALFTRVLPELKQARLVYLQGWGEPLLNPDFFEMVALARQAGCQVGTTTNGMLLDRDRLTRLVDLEVAVLAFSLAGIDSNDRVRRGTRLATVLEQIKVLHEIKAAKGTVLPRIHLAYMLLTSGLGELALLPATLQGLGVSQVVVSTLDFVPSPALAPESLRLAEAALQAEARARLADAAAQSRRLGVDLVHRLPAAPSPAPRCPENVTRALCVAADGTAAPCVFLNLALQGHPTHVGRGGAVPYQRLAFGSLTAQSLGEIWRIPAARAFRREHRRGGVPAPCRSCLHPA